MLYISAHCRTVENVNNTPPHLTVEEFGARLNMAPHAVRRRIRRGPDAPGGIRAINIGSPSKPEYRIPETEVTRYVRDNTVRVA